MGQSNPKHKYRLGREWIESIPPKKDLVVLVNEKVNITRQYVLADQKANRILDYINRSTASRSTEVILLSQKWDHLPGMQYTNIDTEQRNSFY